MKKVLTVILACACSLSLFAQTQEECKPCKTDNLYLGVGVGGMTVLNGGFNTPTFNAHIQLGQYVTPAFGWRTELAGAWQTLNTQGNGFYMSNKPYGEFNFDATINLLNLFGTSDWERKCNLYVFAGPQITLSSAVSMSQDVKYKWTGVSTTSEGYKIGLTAEDAVTEFVSEGVLARVGASAGLGFAYNCNDKLAIKAEARYAVGPSVFGFGSECFLAESTLRATVGITYALTAKRHNPKPHVCPACPECPVVRCPEPEPCPTVVAAPEEPKKEELAVFFKLNRSVLVAEEVAKVNEYAKYIKANPADMFIVAGYADKGTGSVQGNQTISERRAQEVYRLLLKAGVKPSQLKTIGAGGVGVMFNGDESYSRVVIVKAF